MKRIRETPISNESLVEAIRIRCSRVYPAMAIANAFGGTETDDWYVIHNFSLIDMLQEADMRKIDFGSVGSAMPGTDMDPPKLIDCPMYKTARKNIAT